VEPPDSGLSLDRVCYSRVVDYPFHVSVAPFVDQRSSVVLGLAGRLCSIARGS